MKVTPTPGSVSGRRIDRVGDPLEGLVNLFDLSLVLAVGLLLAALSSAGVVGLVAGPSGSGTPIPGQPAGGQNGQGQGTSVGQVYRLQDGSYVFVPSGAAKPGATSGATAGTGSTLGTGSITPPTAGTGTTTPSAATGTPGGATSGL
jgi:hypothetical protein